MGSLVTCRRPHIPCVCTVPVEYFPVTLVGNAWLWRTARAWQERARGEIEQLRKISPRQLETCVVQQL